VIDQLDLGNGLVAIQMHEIPSQSEICEALLNDNEAIEFWNNLAGEKFEISLEDFCESIMKRTRLPIIKCLANSSLSSMDIEGYQKYWGLWLFAGGDEQTFSFYTRNPINPPRSECTISFHRFGFLLAWFGHFGKFLNELFNAVQLKIFYDDKLSSIFSAHILKQNSATYNLKDLWLIRCSPKRDFPFVISYIKVEGNPQLNVSHQRITLNPVSRQYTFQNLITKSVYTNGSIIGLVDIIKRQYNLGAGFQNDKFNLINQPDFLKTQNDQYYVPNDIPPTQ